MCPNRVAEPFFRFFDFLGVLLGTPFGYYWGPKKLKVNGFCWKLVWRSHNILEWLIKNNFLDIFIFRVLLGFFWFLKIQKNPKKDPKNQNIKKIVFDQSFWYIMGPSYQFSAKSVPISFFCFLGSKGLKNEGSPKIHQKIKKWKKGLCYVVWAHFEITNPKNHISRSSGYRSGGGGL